jgi:hypothetical protein
MKVDEAVAFIRQHEKGGWVNLNVKTARSGNYYVELDTYEPTAQNGMKPQEKVEAKPQSKPKQAKPEVEDEEEPDQEDCRRACIGLTGRAGGVRWWR